MGRGWVEGRRKKGRLEELDAEVRRRGWKVVAFTRLIPFLPYNLLNYAFGLTGIKLTHYAAATFVFMLPGIIAYVVFGSSVIGLFQGDISRGFLIGAALAAASMLLPFLYRRFKMKGRG